MFYEFRALKLSLVMVLFLRLINHELRNGERLGSMKEEKPEVSHCVTDWISENLERTLYQVGRTCLCNRHSLYH